MMLRDKYGHLYNQMHVRQEVVEEILATCHADKAQKETSCTLKKRAAVCVVLAISLLGATPVLAANIPAVYSLLYAVSPATAQFFMPVQKSCLDNGIELRVVSTYIHENTAEIYITLQDLISDRIDATTDLYDSYSIHTPFDSAGTCQRVGYDAETKTASFLITITQREECEIAGDKMTFSVREFLSHKRVYKDIAIPLDLSSIPQEAPTLRVDTRGGGGLYKEYVRDSVTTALVPGSPQSAFPVDGILLTGAAYADGMLHIQTAIPNSLQNDNHGFFYFKDPAGNRINSTYSFSFLDDAVPDGENGETHTRTAYNEEVFDIPPEELSAYALHGDFVTSGMYTQGQWKITFALENRRA